MKSAVQPMGQNRPIPGFTRGVNLGNGFDAPDIGEWGVIIEENHFKYAAAAGLDHVRLPVRFSAHALEKLPFTIEENFFKKIDWALDMAQKYKMSLLLDLHHYEEIMKTPTKHHQDRFVAMWKQISERYKNRPATVAFELINEPCFELKPPILNPLLKKTFNLVRKTNPTRLIFVEGYFWSNTEWLDKIDVSYLDKNSVVTFHMYQPILFTHQGAPWMGHDYKTTGIRFPGPPTTPLAIPTDTLTNQWVKDWLHKYNTTPKQDNPNSIKTILEEFDRVSAFIKKTGHRVYLGEFGAVDFADGESRYNFLSAIRKEAERRNIGWCIWDDGGRNQALRVKTGTWTPVIKRALFGE